MSGGHFDFKQNVLKELSHELTVEAISKDFPYDRKTQDKFFYACYLLDKAAIYLHRIDWLLSGDDGEVEFHRRLKEELEKFEGGD
jgi:hypothetical protein